MNSRHSRLKQTSTHAIKDGTVLAAHSSAFIFAFNDTSFSTARSVLINRRLIESLVMKNLIVIIMFTYVHTIINIRIAVSQ